MITTDTPIRFTKINRYRRAIGSIDTTMGFGVRHELVQRGIAEWVTVPVAVAHISEPVASTHDDDSQFRKTSRRRDNSKE